MKNSEMVKEFMTVFGQNFQTKPDWPKSESEINMRLRLVDEEVGELRDAINDRDIVEVADALADILYIVYGTANTFGIDIDACMKEVHRSNMTKLDKDGKVQYRDDGKILKGEQYEEPNLLKVLLRQK